MREQVKSGTADEEITFRHPVLEDAKEMVRLVRESKVLDVNSDYAYLLLCLHFSETCLIAEMSGTPIGFASGYRPPGQPDRLFVWQVAVDARARGRGVASQLLDHLICGAGSECVRYIEATITPSNTASRALFRSLARRHDAECQVSPVFSEGMFAGSGEHEGEDLFRVGPISRDKSVDS